MVEEYLRRSDSADFITIGDLAIGIGRGLNKISLQRYASIRENKPLPSLEQSHLRWAK